MATYGTIPLSWGNSTFNGVIDLGVTEIPDGGSLSYASITQDGPIASVVGDGSFTLDHVRINSDEGVRVGGSGSMNISNSFIETTGLSGDHADGLQAYDPGGTGDITITNTTIVSHNDNATAGIWIADSYSGSLTLDNVVFEGGPYGLRIAADASDIYVSLTNVYFVEPFAYGPFLFQDVNAHIHITHWENVHYATIVNGELVPGALIQPPEPVEGAPGGGPTITAFSSDTGVVGDGITSDNTLTLSGTASANSTVNILDGTKHIGSITANASGSWTYATGILADGTHDFTATAIDSSGNTSGPSSALPVTVDTVAPSKPLLSSFSPDTTPANDGHTTAATLTLSGTGEANSTVQVFDGTKSLGTAPVDASGDWSFTTSNLVAGVHNFTATDIDAAGNTSVASAALQVTVDPSPATTNLVVNGDFETGDFTGWALSGNVAPLSYGPQVFVTSNAESGQYAAGLGSVGSDGTLSQDIQTTAGQHYTLDFWLANASGGPDDFSVKWNGQTLLALVYTSAQGYTEYKFDVVGTASKSHLEFDARQDPSHWSLDSISVTPAVGVSPPPPPPPSTNLVVNGGFETGDFNGWAPSGNVGTTQFGPQLFIANGAHTGNDAAGFGSMGQDGTISQSLKTVAGQQYTLDFWLANLSAGPNDFTAKIAGITELHLANVGPQGYNEYTYTFTATSTSTILEFDFRQDPSEWHLDDVTVVVGTVPLHHA